MKDWFRINRMTLIASCILTIGLYSSAIADNSKCWGILGDDKRRPEISCTPLTEKLLLSLRNATRKDVFKAMNAPGEPTENGTGLHFVTNTVKYDGGVIFLFKDDSVVNISAILKPSDDYPGVVEFIWNSDGNICSDFPNSPHHCN